MRRQLYRGGGITGLYPRKKFGLGSDLKDTFRKLIPNELADIAVKAAPFVAPFNPGVAGLMRGIGRFDQRGSISDALKQGLATTAFGAGTRYLGGQRGIEDIMGGGLRNFSSPISENSSLRDIFEARELSKKERIAKEIAKKKSIKNTPAFMQRATEATIGKVPGLRALPPMVQQQLLVGGAIAGASTLASLFKGEFRPQEEGESMEEYLAARKDVVGKQMRIYMDNYFKFDPEYSQLDDAGRNAFVARYNVAQGGRIGFDEGANTKFAMIKDMLAKGMDTDTIMSITGATQEEINSVKNERVEESQGGRIGQMRGTGPNGLPGIPRMAPDGMEFDMRQNGGFQPLGAKEKKDDVPAMLAKNEFVMTADAVRGAGNGDIELGEQKMYDTMKYLERRVT